MDTFYPETPSPVRLLILQATPFCNIWCNYCYLPERNDTSRISPEVVTATVQRLTKDGLLDQRLTIAWHAGEPLALPVEYYRTLFAAAAAACPPGVSIKHAFQTNAVPISQAWCDLFREHQVSIGVSIDGPRDINDRHRLDRKGNSTFDRVMAGIQLLQDNKIPFHTISVVGDASLGKASEIHEFLLGLKPTSLAFNVEESEGCNTSELAGKRDIHQRVDTFLQELFAKHQASNTSIRLREFHRMAHRMKRPDVFNYPVSNDLNQPGGIISVNTEGDFSTFSPELLGDRNDRFGNFIFGNVLRDSFREAFGREKFQLINEEIQRGVARCKATCDYFALCGGGAPSNKFHENGTFDSTETLYCYFNIQSPANLILADAENRLRVASINV